MRIREVMCRAKELGSERINALFQFQKVSMDMEMDMAECVYLYYQLGC